MVRFAFALVGASFALRLVLVFLPELGRDEAAYLYWTHHPRLDYAPLFQLQIFLARLVSEAPWLLRSTQLVIGALTVWLFGQWMRERGAVPCVGAVAIATMPWLVFAGGILHPDGLLVAGLLLYALGIERGRPWPVATGVTIAAGAKLSGFLAVPVALVWLVRRRAWLPLAVAIVCTGAFAAWLRPETLAAARNFARLDLDVFARIGLLVVEVALLGGVLLAAARWRPSAVAVTGVLFVAGFGLAVIVTGQVKANWLLPGLLLLWSPSLPRGILVAGAVVGTVLSGAMVAGHAAPGLAGTVERSVTGSILDYPTIAGAREARVSSADSWRDYLAGFHAGLDWPDLPAEVAEVDEIVSDDYGIACRLALACPSGVPRVVVPGDPLFDAEPGRRVERRLIVAVRTDPGNLAPSGEPLWSGSIAHPVTREPMSLVLVELSP